MFIFWIYLPHMRENMWPLSFWTWLTSFNMVTFNSIRLLLNHIVSFLWLNKTPYTYMHTCIHTYTYIYSQFLDPYISCRACGLFCCCRACGLFGCCEQCYNKLRCTGVSIVSSLIFLQVYAQNHVICYMLFWLGCFGSFYHGDILISGIFLYTTVWLDFTLWKMSE
jgi:hypothetical protein